MRKEMLVHAGGQAITTINAAANLNKLLQLSGGAVYSDTGEIVEFDASNRLKVLQEVIDEASHKVLIFVPYRHAIEIVSEELKKDYTVDLIHGGISAGKRTEIFDRFQTSENPKILVIQPQAASHGVTLHAADTIVYWSPVMSVETYLQANARVHRAGQKNKTTVFHLQGSQVERKLYRMLQDKVDIHTRITDLYGELLS
jgi:SNF2 family DNA or RNA helicase